VSTDYHLHTPLCHHAVGHPREYVTQAQERGLQEIGFADHNPMPVQYDNWRMSKDDLPRYVELVGEARETGFPVRLGLECDYIPGYEGWIEQLSKLYPWDYLIGSVHYLGPGWDVDNPELVYKFEQVPVDEIWDLYWANYLRCIRSGLFDFVAHPDLPKKFGYRPKTDPRPAYEKVIQALVDHDVAFELNTAGWRKAVGEQYPALDFLKLAASAGVPVLVNSDAHAPEEVGAGFAQAHQLLREAGYRERVQFQGRRRFRVPL
jgi:histidinol-phosphatase (PHP family)